MEAELEKTAASIKAAQSILIIGGGPCGLEMAGEIAAAYPDKKITLVHSGPQLLHDHEGVHPKLAEKYTKILQEAKVEVVLGEKVKLPADGYDPTKPCTLQTDKGRDVTSDYQLLAWGAKPATEFLASFDDGKVLNAAKRIKVNDRLQVQGHPNIFAVFVSNEDGGTWLKCIFIRGDVNDVACWKVSYLAGPQGGQLGAAIAKVMKKQQGGVKPGVDLTQELPVYKVPGFKVLSLVAGPRKGATQMGGMTVGNWMTSNVKGKSIFHQMSWALLNQKPPK